MHSELVAKKYKIALNYCNASKTQTHESFWEILNNQFIVLGYEEKNETMKTFHKLLTKKLEMSE